MLDGDDIGKLKQKDVKKASNSIKMIYLKILQLSLSYDCVCFGFVYGGDEFALILWDELKLDQEMKENESSDLLLRTDVILNGLIKEIKESSDVTASIGFTRVKKEELARQWIRRAANNLKIAKKNGKNQSYCDKDTVFVKNERAFDLVLETGTENVCTYV